MSRWPEPAGLLYCPTPDDWLRAVPGNLPALLIDHANCEKKAASTALGMLYRYLRPAALVARLSRLAREELRHFEQVMEHLERLDIAYQPLSASRYAGALREHIRVSEPERLVDTLLVNAVVEARSCERFERLAPVLDEPLRGFYQGLLDSERRHYRVYLEFAEDLSAAPIGPRLEALLVRDAELITAVDDQFRFHSGPPAES